MSTYTFTLPDGSTMEVNDPEGAYSSAEEAYRSAMQHQNDQVRTHPAPVMTREDQLRQIFSERFNVPQSQIDLGAGVSQAHRLGAGILSDNPQEQGLYYQGIFPNSQIEGVDGVMGIQTTPGASPIFANPPGFDVGDVTQFGGEVAMPGLAALATAGKVARVGGVPGALIGAVATGGAEIAREGLQTLAGTQAETLPQVATRAGLSAGAEVLAPAYRGIKTLVAARGGDELSSLLKNASDDDLATILGAVDEGFDLPKLMNFQKSKNPVLQKLAFQAMQFSDKAQTRVADQLKELAVVSRKMIPELGDPSSADALVQRSMRQHYNRTLDELAPAPAPEAAGLSFQKGVQEGLDTRKRTMQANYDVVDAEVAKAQPRFDISKAQQAAKERERYALGLTEEEKLLMPDAQGVLRPVRVQEVQDILNVADPNRKLARINGLLSRMDATQVDYEVLKELRTQVGGVLDMPLARRMEGNVDIGQAKRLYGALSKELLSPQNADEVPGYVKAIKEANTSAKRYYDTYDQTQVKQVLASTEGQTPVGLYNALAKNPASLETAFREVLQEAKDKPEVLGTVRRNLESTLLRSDDPVSTMRAWSETNPQLVSWLYPTPQKQAIARRNAEHLALLNSGPAREAADTSFEQVGFAMHTLKEASKVRPGTGLSPVGAASRLVQTVGGPGSEGHGALRNAIMADTIEASLIPHKTTGVDVIDPEALAKKVKEMKDEGWYGGILTRRDKKAIDALSAFARASAKSGESGTGLAVASQIGQMRQGDVGAIMSYRLSATMANMLTDTNIPLTSLFAKTGKAPGLSSPTVGRILAPLARQAAAVGVAGAINQ